jgi:hypothetical protein
MMNHTNTKFSHRFHHEKVIALACAGGLVGVIAFFALPYLVPVSDATMQTTIGAVVGLTVGCLLAIFGGSLFRKN